MVRRVRIAVQTPLISWSGAVLCCASAGCLGGAQPVPPALDPIGTHADAGDRLDASGGFAADAGPTTPSPDDRLSDFAGAGAAAETGGLGWRWPLLAPPPWAPDAGAPSAADAAPAVDSGDGH